MTGVTVEVEDSVGITEIVEVGSLVGVNVFAGSVKAGFIS
jgi:hypothetical protein